MPLDQHLNWKWSFRYEVRYHAINIMGVWSAIEKTHPFTVLGYGKQMNTIFIYIYNIYILWSKTCGVFTLLWEMSKVFLSSQMPSNCQFGDLQMTSHNLS